jgi:hypothetical protein
MEKTILARWPGFQYNWYKTVESPEGLSVRVPREWDVSRNQELTLGSRVVGPAILASQTDTVKWWTSYGVSGLYLAASRDRSVLASEPEVIIEKATNASTACKTQIITRTQEEREYIVSYIIWDKCGETNSKLLAFVGRPVNGEHLVLGLMTIVHEGDWEARKRIFTSFDVNQKKLSNWKPMSSPLESAGPAVAASSETRAVAAAIRGHYEAIGAGNFEKAYSYFGPTYRKKVAQEAWVSEEESYQITSSTVNSLDVTYVDDTTATANVDVSFTDKNGTARFLLTWRLVKEGARWKLDEQTSGEEVIE